MMVSSSSKVDLSVYGLVTPRGSVGRRRRKGVEKQIAQERIDILFRNALEEARRDNISRSDRYVQLARRIGMRYNVGIPAELRLLYCKSCYGYLLPGKTSLVRVHRGRVILHCTRCGEVRRLPYVKEIKERRQKKTEAQLVR